MFSYLAQIHVEVIQNSRGEYLVEELNNVLIHLSQTQLSIVENHDLLAKSVQEVQSSLIQCTGTTNAHHHQEGNVLVRDLERTMEVLAGMESRRMDPLHLLQQADKLRRS